MRWRAERWIKARHLPIALAHDPGFVLRNGLRMMRHTFRGMTARTWLGLESEREAFRRYKALRRKERRVHAPADSAASGGTADAQSLRRTQSRHRQASESSRPGHHFSSHGWGHELDPPILTPALSETAGGNEPRFVLTRGRCPWSGVSPGWTTALGPSWPDLPLATSCFHRIDMTVTGRILAGR